MKYAPVGDAALTVQFENVISLEVNRAVQSFAAVIERQHLTGVSQLIIAFNSLAVCYDPLKISYSELVHTLQSLESSEFAIPSLQGRTLHVPVVFGDEFGPDLNDVARQSGLSPEDVVQRMTSRSYYVYMVGFIDGLPYCGDLDEPLRLPRRPNPRIKVSKGSVAISGGQTTVYTVDTPGGWHLLGWTPMKLFDAALSQPCALAAGDEVRYISITEEESKHWDEHRQREWDRQWNG
ncbi:5-oxoprolinase subunit PxpB [Paenibacillaceae bacterium]|nr:5-oxoprolinase subunit PxpB [Paenibacillaceae bacterium]